jgi:hypothetical protein
MSEMKKYCSYYQAHIPREYCWFVVAGLKGYDHVALDRTIDVKNSIFEFFVPIDMEPLFCELMEAFIVKGCVQNLKKLKNRLLSE